MAPARVPTTTDEPSTARPAAPEPVLVVDGASKRYGGVTALAEVSLRALPGEVHAVLGENGAGKSTLMGVITGTVQPDEGQLTVRDADGEAVTASGLTPAQAVAAGIAIVRQHPAVLPDLTVLENLRVALPPGLVGRGAAGRAAAAALLERAGLRVGLGERVEDLSVAQRHQLEIAKALAVRPRVLILDEPTAPLSGDAVALLFERIREQVASGTAVIYITHRMAEVRELADAVTVLRDGRVRGTRRVEEVTDHELLALILGRQLDSTFPPKHPSAGGAAELALTGFSGPGFEDVTVTAQRGQVVGLAGVVGNGQSAVLRSLAGLQPFEGRVEVAGAELATRELRRRAAYMPADRQHEGLLMSLSVKENAAVSALRSFTRGPVVDRRREEDAVSGALGSLSVKASSLDAPVTSLSGGNAQKVVIARALLSEPSLLLADEPTQGVDVGARAEIYDILRAASARGVPVVVSSSDAKELEGLCDVVVVMSRGHAVAVLRDEEVTEAAIVGAAVSARTHAAGGSRTAGEEPVAAPSGGLRRFLRGDYAPPALVAAVIVLLGAVLVARDPEFLSPFNTTTLLTAATALGFIALGQNIVLMTGGIDLSVGPLAGFLVVVASFFVNDGSVASRVALGIALMLAVALVTGLVNGSLVRFARFTPIAATLVLYIALGGVALLVRPTQDGYISQAFQDLVNASAGPLPVMFVVMVVLVVLLEVALRRTRWGWRLRAVGSHEESARNIGIRVDRTVVGAYAAASLCVLLGAFMLMGQYGVGDPAQGSSYTLTSVTAVVLGGTSLLGGRGTFVGPLLGAVLLQQTLTATVFLGLGSVYQYFFQGALVLAAAVLYTAVSLRRRRRTRARTQTA